MLQSDSAKVLQPVYKASKIKLAFPGLHTLWAFVTTIGFTSIEINTKDATVYCECSEEHINLAIKKFEARVVEGELSGY